MAPLSKFSEYKDAIVAASSILLERGYLDPMIKATTSDTMPDLVRRTSKPTTPASYHPGVGTTAPQKFNNKALFGLFGILGAAMVVVSIWFFFWAKNGGFIWRKGDWDDYKSTVLRRKGKDGKTLSNATKSTDLGQRSIAGTFEIERGGSVSEKSYAYTQFSGDDKRRHKKRSNVDDDVRAYRKEKPARVGGINREADGSHFDYTNTDRSEISSQSPANKDEQKKRKDKKDKKDKKAKKETDSFSKAKPKDKEEKTEDKKNQKDERKRGHKGTKSTDRLLDPNEELEREERRRKRRAARHAAMTEGSTVSTISDWSEGYSALSGSTVSYISASEAQNTHDATSSYYDHYRPSPYVSSPLRPSGDHNRQNEQREHRSHRERSSRPSSYVSSDISSSSRQSSPRKRDHVYPNYPSYPGTFTDNHAPSEEQDSGTKAYPHHIAGLSRSNGFRRGGASRTESVIESDGDLGTLRSFRRT